MANSNAATIAKVPDGDVSIGNLNGEIVTLNDAATAYVTGGYPFVDQSTVNNAGTGSVNVDLWKIVGIIPLGGQGGITPVYNLTTKKLQMFWVNALTSALGEVPNGTDLSALTFQLLVIGY
jgi:hypothetical protein